MANNNYSIKYVFEAIDSMSNNLRDMKRNLKDFENGVGGADNKVKTFEERMKSASNSLKSFANKTKYISTALTGIGIAGIYNFAKIEKGLTNVNTLLKDEKQVKQYENRLKGLNKEAIKMGISTDDAGQGLFDVVSGLGISENSLKTFQDAQVLAIGGNASLASSVLGMTKILNVYGKETTNTKEVANALFTAQRVGTTTVQDLAQNVGKVSGTAKMAGMSFQEMLSTLSVLTNTLSNTEEASTSMVAIIKAVTNPADQAGLILEKLGIKTGITAIKQQGMADVLKKVRNAMVKHEDAIAMAIPEIRALKGLTTLTDESLKLMDDTVVQMGEDLKVGTGLMQAYNMQTKTLDFAIKQLKGSFVLMTAEIGEKLAPFVIKLTGYIKMLSDWFVKLNPNTKSFIIAIGVIGALLAPVALALAGVATVVGFLGAKFLIVTAIIGGIATAIAGTYIYWETFTNYINSVIDRVLELKNIFIPLSSAFKLFDIGAKIIGEKFGTQEIVQPRMDAVMREQSIGTANINIGLNAPKGVVKNFSSETKGTGLNLGLNMAGVR
jgi:TP901 family phage tail tape measure protein